MLNGKTAIILLTVGLIKKTIWMKDFFPEPKSSAGRMKFESDLPNYARKADFKNATGADTSKSVKC